MSTNRIFATLAVGVSCLTYSFAQELATPANDAATQRSQQYDPAVDTDAHTSNYRGDSVTSANLHRASEIIGLNVLTPDSEDTIGEIDDLVIDAQSGTIRYAAVSVGGFLGIGDKLVAVPWKAFKHQKDDDGESLLTLDTNKEKLEAAPGFNEDNWPDFANPQWTSENDRHYGVSVNINTNR